jgi:hypothetical protein
MSLNQQNYEQNCIISIETDNLVKVKQFLSNGSLNVNSILTYRHKIWDSSSLPLLSIAAFSGAKKTLDYLLQKKVSINQTDRVSARTALHWASVSNNLDACKTLIEAGANVNARDRDKITPLIFAVNSNNPQIVKLLIKSGAHVNTIDRSLCTPLHYACVHFHPNIARDIIVNGCISNTNFSTMFAGTPLKFLVYDKQYYTAKCLIELGCDLSNELKWINDGPFTVGTKVDEEFIAWLRSYVKRPPKLISLCRRSIRGHLGDMLINDKVKRLNVPTFLKDYLMSKF